MNGYSTFWESHDVFAIVSGLYECFRYRSSLLNRFCFKNSLGRDPFGLRWRLISRRVALCLSKSMRVIPHSLPFLQLYADYPASYCHPPPRKAPRSIRRWADFRMDSLILSHRKDNETNGFQSARVSPPLAVCLRLIKEWAAFRITVGNASHLSAETNAREEDIGSSAAQRAFGIAMATQRPRADRSFQGIIHVWFLQTGFTDIKQGQI